MPMNGLSILHDSDMLCETTRMGYVTWLKLSG